MPREDRLDRIYTGLTALERARLVMKTWHDGKREDSRWRQTMPQRQGREFNEYIYVMNAANLYVGHMINGLDADLQLLWERVHRLVLLARWLEVTDDDAPSGPRVGQRPAEHLVAAAVASLLPELDGAFETLADDVTAGAARLWTSMRSVEVGLDEMTKQFDGTDPLMPRHRERLVAVRDDLTELIEMLNSYDFDVERREPDEEMLLIVRGTIPAMRYMMG